MSEDNQAQKPPQRFLKRLADSISYMLTKEVPQSWMGPGQPLVPVAQEVKGRQMDFPVGANINARPKNWEGVSYEQLRFLADNCPQLRQVIETRKDQISRLKFTFQNKDPEKNKGVNQDPRIKKLIEFFQMPDRIHNWDDWVRALCEDMFVIDAPVLYPRKTLGGEVYSFDLIDGATIKVNVDQMGRQIIDGDELAFSQELKGVSAVGFKAGELVFSPRNVRTNKFYGYSPVEQMVPIIQIQMLKDLQTLNFYRDGNLPNTLLSTPPEWDAQQIELWQLYWDEKNKGLDKNQAKFVPHGMEPYNTRPDNIHVDYDEWLVRLICAAFNMSPQAYVRQMNRATAETQKESAEEDGLAPVKEWLRNLINYLIFTYFGFEDIEFTWITEKEADAKSQAEIHRIYLEHGVLSINEIRKDLGRDPFSDQELQEFFDRKKGPQLTNAQQEQEDDDADGNSNSDGAPFQNKMWKNKKKTFDY